MLKKWIVPALCTAMTISATGCHTWYGSMTAVEVAKDEGILNIDDDEADVVSLIQSGQADKMLREGRCKVKHDIRGPEGKKVLISRYLVGGETYRIEVRPQVNPMKNVARRRLRYVRYVKGDDNSYIANVSKLYNCITEDSFDAKPEIAYRAWKGLDGKLHPITVMAAPAYDWRSHQKDLHLYIHTKEWPLSSMWLRGLTSEGRRKPPGGLFADDFYNYNLATSTLETETQDTRACDGRWVMESPGPGVNTPPFVNFKLYDAILASTGADPLNALSITNGADAVSSRLERRRKINMINDIMERELQEDWDQFWFYNKAPDMNKWHLDAPR